MRPIFTIVALIFTLSLSAQIGESSGEKEQKTLGGIVTLLNGYETNGSAQISINETPMVCSVILEEFFLYMLNWG